MTLRPAAPEDAPALAALETLLFGPDSWSESAVRDELTGPGRHSVVAVSGADVVGYAVTLRAHDVADLQRIAVRPDHQRRGLAHRMLEDVLAAARQEGADRVLLEVSADNAAALGFYTREGFVEIDRRRRYYRDGSDAVVMRRSLERGGRDGRGREHG